MKIAIASGKGGTGKTTVSINLNYYLSKFYSENTTLIDCDVEEPNDALFFREPKLISAKQMFRTVPDIDTNQCTFCKKCADWCEFNAITILKNRQYAKIDKDLCHSCGACTIACNFGAINQKSEPLGFINHYDTGVGNRLIEGKLEIGSALQTALIKEVKREITNEEDIIIYDAPPGTSCPVVETVADVDYIILVTEPTPFGLHDLKITVELLKDLNKQFGVIVNKAELGSNEVYDFLKRSNIELLGKIPFSKKYAAQYSQGNLLENIPLEMEKIYVRIIEKLKFKFSEQLRLQQKSA